MLTWHISFQHKWCNMALRILCLILYAFTFVIDKTSTKSFIIDYERNCFLKDGQPFRYISGGLHYFRVPDFYWEDRMKKMRSAGLNTIQTYVAWNVHEPVKGKYVFSGMYDIEKFVKIAQDNDLLMIIRAGPYICAEWEFGGFPAWLLKNRSIILRSSKDDAYLQAIHTWLGVLLPKLKPFLYSNGGPIISFQVENEYGSYYTCDHAYMRHLKETFVKYLGEDVVLFTTDGYSDQMLKCGGIPKLYRTVDFGAGDPSVPFKQQRKYEPAGPLVNSEYYTGWLDHWGEAHQRRDGKTIAKYLDQILALNASVNMYMFEGGTNFGFMNGANSAGGKLLPVPTSYDYDAPLNEAGDPTEKYFDIKKVISKYAKIPPGPTPKPTFKAAFGRIKISKITSIYSLISKLYPSGSGIKTRYPMTMEEINQNYGFLLYRTALMGMSKGDGLLTIKSFHDRAVVLVDKVVQGRLDRNSNNSINIQQGSVLDILVENQGRINYGPINDPKGILENVTFGDTVIENWEMFPLTFENLTLHLMDIFESVGVNQTSVPLLAMASFSVDQAADTFLQLDGWSKGQAFVNGHNLGRYWPAVGPQKTLFVPSNYLLPHPKMNSVILFELDSSPCVSHDGTDDFNCFIEFVNKPNIG